MVAIILGANAKIIDYSAAQYIPIHDGNIIVWEEYGYMGHTVNLTSYGSIIEKTSNLSKLLPQSHMKKILEADGNLTNTS